MTASLLSRLAAAAVLSLAAAAARADDVTVSGNIAFHNDVVQVDFSLAAAGTAKVWTDSWQSGLNFDPTGALWIRSAAGFELIDAVDDNDAAGPNQGAYDFGFALPLAAGDYRVTLAASFNEANGNRLAQGFAYDTETPVPIGAWDQPSYDPNADDQKSSFWQLQFTGVDRVALVPEPSRWLLLALGLAGVTITMHRLNRSKRRGQAVSA